MSPKTIKWLDRYFGIALCFILSLVKSLSLGTSNRLKPNKVIFIKLIEQGASVLAYTALKEAVEKYGKQNVYFLVFSENRPILDFLSILEPNNIIEINGKGLLQFTQSFISQIIQIRKLKIDACIDMEFFSRTSAVIAYLSGAKIRVGLYNYTSEHPYRGSLITHKIQYNPYLHVSRYYLLLLRALEQDPSEVPMMKVSLEEFAVNNPNRAFDQKKINEIKDRFGLDDSYSKFILFNPNASDMMPLRKWDVENFIKVHQQIIKYHPQTLVIYTGLEEEKKMIELATSSIDSSSVLNLAGKTNLHDLMGLYQIVDLVLTNDSGPAHFASIFKTPIVVLFGPESPQLFSPLGEHVHVIYKKLACSPCVNVFNHRFSPCNNNLCMQSISVNEVYSKIKSILQWEI